MNINKWRVKVNKDGGYAYAPGSVTRYQYFNRDWRKAFAYAWRMESVIRSHSVDNGGWF